MQNKLPKRTDEGASDITALTNSYLSKARRPFFRYIFGTLLIPGRLLPLDLNHPCHTKMQDGHPALPVENDIEYLAIALDIKHFSARDFFRLRSPVLVATRCQVMEIPLTNWSCVRPSVYTIVSSLVSTFSMTRSFVVSFRSFFALSTSFTGENQPTAQNEQNTRTR